MHVPALALSVHLVVAAPAAPGLIGDFGAWSAFWQGSGAQSICYLAARPRLDRGRSDSVALVTHRPAASSFAELSIQAGADLAEDAPPRVIVGVQRFELVARGATAWVHPQDQERLAAALSRAQEMIVTLHPASGDTEIFSLLGYDRGLRAIDRACRRR